VKATTYGRRPVFLSPEQIRVVGAIHKLGQKTGTSCWTSMPIMKYRLNSESVLQDLSDAQKWNVDRVGVVWPPLEYRKMPGWLTLCGHSCFFLWGITRYMLQAIRSAHSLSNTHYSRNENTWRWVSAIINLVWEFRRLNELLVFLVQHWVQEVF
jgi:hypothetical protein